MALRRREQEEQRKQRRREKEEEEHVMKMLIADDDFVSRNLLHAIVMPYGKSDMAGNGREAMEAFESSWEADKPYEIIFLDIRMPEIDGQEVLRQIRRREDQMGIRDDQKAKVVMVTSSRDLATVKAARDSHCDAYLVKPIERDRVLDELSRLKAMVGSAANAR
jgi:two-component system, chemotaxis family, chemotaxis protein CheY